ncbi:MAG TPA: hypothetical protein VLJ15_04785 [Gammaproteobacteria bacterium]|nr:hypothetical protein [Gammaproteobacteria bacterium]
MKKLSLFFTTLVFAFTTSTFAADLSGVYDCKGHAPSEKEYTDGVLTVSRSGGLYDFSWQFAKEKSNTKGKGVFNKEDENTVAVLFTIEKPLPKETGVIIYKTTSDGIKGTAIIGGKSTSGGETCIKRK